MCNDGGASRGLWRRRRHLHSRPAPGPSTYLLGGTVTGLAPGGSLTLSNGSDVVAVSANGSFKFPRKSEAGASYKVSMTTPSGYDCRISNEAATVKCMPYVLAGMEAALRQPAGLVSIFAGAKK